MPTLACCSITAINKTTGIVTAREKSGGRTIEIKASPAQVQNLRVGQDLFANLETKKASLDGKVICCDLIFAAATPSPAALAPTLSAAPQPTKPQAPAQVHQAQQPQQPPKTASIDPAKTLGAPAQALPGQRLPGQPPASTPAPTPAHPTTAQLPLPSKAQPAEPPKTSGPLSQAQPGRPIPDKISGSILSQPTPMGSAQPYFKPKVLSKPCVTAVMSSPLLLKIDGVIGDSRDACHRDEIEPLSFQMGSAGGASGGGGGGGGTGSWSMVLTKRVDISSGALFIAAVSGKHFSVAVLTVLVQSGAQPELMTYTMKDIQVTSFQQNVGPVTIERVELRFKSLGEEVQKTAMKAQAAPAALAADIFVRIPTIGGDSQDSQHLHEIAAQTMSFSVTSGGSGSGSGGGTGKANIGDFVVEKGLDSASPKLLLASNAGTHQSEVVFTLRAQGGADFFVIKLSDVIVSGDTQQASGSGQKETVRFKPSKITVSYGAPNAPGKLSPVGWDVRTATRL